MEQQKIGKFIAQLRKEKGMTQQELAKKIGVTNKAISKWENGHGLMDIAMLKPLSEQLDVTVMELMNGEKIAMEEIVTKTDEFVDNTIKLANKKVIERVKSGVRVIGTVMLIIVLFIGYMFCKSIAVQYIFNYELMACDGVLQKEEVYNGLAFDKEIVVERQKLMEEDYLIVNNIELYEKKYSLKIRNDFNNMDTEKWCSDETIKNNNCNHFYSLTDNQKNFKEIVYFDVDNTAIDYFKMYSNEAFGDTQEYREKFLKKNKLNNDLELLKYIRNNYHLNEDINLVFDSFKDIRDNYMIVDFINGDLSNIKSSTIITGDYEGYMLTTVYDYDIGFDADEVICKTVYILKNDVVYTLRFIGNDYTDEYIQDLLSTLVIE